MATKTNLTGLQFAKLLSDAATKMVEQQDEIKSLKQALKDRDDAYLLLAVHHSEKCTCLDVF